MVKGHRLWLHVISFVFLGAVSVFGQAAEPATEVPAAEAMSGQLDWVEQLVKGGWTVVALGLLTLMGLGFLFERLANCRVSRIAPSAVFAKLKRLNEQHDYDGMRKLCRSDRSTLTDIVRFVMDNQFTDFNQMAVAAGDIGSQSIRLHQQRAYMLMVVATASPLLGLLGTVIGMIEAFQIVAIAGSMGDASILADSISKALVTTAVGLLVAIPFLLLYHFFRSKTSKLAILLEKQVTELLFVWQNAHLGESSEAEPEEAS